jgi:hypothetical protein
MRGGHAGADRGYVSTPGSGPGLASGVRAVVGSFAPAFAIAFARPWAYLVAAVAAGGMAGLLLWSAGLLAHSRVGWELYASPQELATVGALALLFGLLVPLQIAALARARSAASSIGGVVGTITGILSLSCCAPLLIPAVLSFVGFSGTALIYFNVAMRDYSTLLSIGSIGLMLASIGFVSHTITATCAVPLRQHQERTPGKRLSR